MRNIRDCSTCVVGGAGFLGSHLVQHLIEDRNCRVLVLDNLSAGWFKFIHPKADFEHCDITKSETRIRDLFKGYGVEYVFNYAAQPYVPVSFERPLHVFELNALGAMQVINAAQEAGCKGILQVSSAEIYGGYDWDGSGGTFSYYGNTDPIKETFPVQPHSSYGAAKAAVDYFVQVRWREAKTPCIALRQFNAYGPSETHEYVIPEIISQLHENGPVVRLGNNSTRDFQFAKDAVCSAVELLEYGNFGEFYNLGSEESIKIYDLARLIGKLMGHEKIEIQQDPARVRPWEIWFLKSDSSKIKSVIKYRHQTSLEDGLRMTIASFLENGGRWCWQSRPQISTRRA